MNLWRRLGYPEAALADSDRALADAREIGQAATLTGQPHAGVQRQHDFSVAAGVAL